MSDQLPEIDPVHFRKVMGCHAAGVAVITALTSDGSPVGMAVTSFTSVSLDPPLVAFCPDRKSSTWPKIEAAGKFCVNLLAQGQIATCRSLGGRGVDKFEGVLWHTSAHGMPVLDGALATIECTIHSVIEAGDHFIVLGRVLTMQANDELSPLVFFRSAYAQVASAP